MRKQIISTLLTALLVVSAAQAKPSKIDISDLSANSDNEQLAQTLRSKSALVFQVYGDNRETLLMLLLKNDRDSQMIQTALSFGAYADESAKNGMTPLMYAAKYSSSRETVDILVKHEAMSKKARKKRILATDNSGMNAFDHAAENPDRSIYDALAAYTDDPNAERNKIQDAQEPVAEEPEATPVLESEDILPKVSVTAMPAVPAVPVVPVSEETEEEEISEPEPEEPYTEPYFVPEEPVAEPAVVVPAVAEEIQETAEIPAAEEKVNPEIAAYTQEYIYDNVQEEPEVQEPVAPQKIADPDAADKDGVTLLMKAAKSGNDWDLNLLLESGADVNLRDRDGWTALMYAARYQNSLHIVDMLLEKGAKIRVRNKFNATPLLMAADYSQNPEIIRRLLENRSNSEDEVFRSFIFAITGNSMSDHVRKAKLKLFLDMDLPVNRIWKGQTPLMYAAQYCTSTEVLALLLEAGAKPEIRNAEGKSAFDYAKANRKLPKDDVYWSLNQAGGK